MPKEKTDASVKKLLTMEPVMVKRIEAEQHRLGLRTFSAAVMLLLSRELDRIEGLL